MNEMINQAISAYVESQELSGAALCVLQNGKMVFRNKWGYSSIEKDKEIEYNSIYRMMSMTKVITAVAVLICVQRGKLALDAPLSEYIPEFADMKTAKDERYVFSPDKMAKIPLLLASFSMQDVKNRASARQITIRDLLSHSSGLQQGLCGLLAMLGERSQFDNLRDYVLHYAKHVLDFDPGCGTGYSPVAGFDILGYLVALVSGVSFETFIQKEICQPLGMTDTTFFLNEEQKARLVEVYKLENGKLVNVTGTKDDICGVLHQNPICFEHGSGGLYSTLDDYSRFAQMLLNGGELDGVRLLSQELVSLMHTEAPKNHLEPEPGFVWGLGVKIRQDPVKGNTPATKGTYGWSGAFGTHFFISPEDNLTAIFMTNRSDLNGSGSYVSKKIEELVFSQYGKKVKA